MKTQTPASTASTQSPRIVPYEGRGLIGVPGFRAYGVHVGLKKKKRDVCIIVSDRPTAAAAVFTQNEFAAAPVHLSRAHVSDGDVRAIVCNSGNANACTGDQGMRDAEEMAVLTAKALGVEPHQVLVSSTGIIGRPLDMDKVREGIRLAAEGFDLAEGHEAAEAIMTTDKVPKTVELRVEAEGRTFHVAGIAKGSGMIHPNMATMLGFLVTDAPIDAKDLQPVLKRAVDATYNMITVDGDSSTNDTVAVLANGAEGGPVLVPGSVAFQTFETALTDACRVLAKAIARDGEGATKLIEVAVHGAPSIDAARAAARTVAGSSLVKSALHGGDPNWGRIVAAVGRSGFPLDPTRVTVAFEANGAQQAVFEDGTPLGADERKAAAPLLQASEVRIVIDLGVGTHRAEAWGCDLSPEYVTFNSAYST